MVFFCRAIFLLLLGLVGLAVASSRAAWANPPVIGQLDRTLIKVPQQPGDVWDRLRQGFRLGEAPDTHPLLPQHLAWHQARPQHMRQVAERARPYLYHIVEAVERRAMPMEVALIPFIESAFIPTALSRSNAAGIWQFIPSTGTHYGLRQTDWYDGRRDFLAATEAALDYLGKLYLDFGDWQLAFAAYNCGEGCVARAIERNAAQGLPTDYASLPLPEETRHYVPKLLAVRQVILAPERFGVALTPIPDAAYFERVRLTRAIDAQAAARLAGMDKEEFLALNAAFPRRVLHSDAPIELILPAGRADTFQRNLESGDWDRWQPYTVRRGERPADVARRLGVSLARLEAHNTLRLQRGRFAADQTLLVPVTAAQRHPAGRHAPATHTVARGDTLSSIARRHGLTLTALKAANPGVSANLQPGMTLRLTAAQPARAGRPTHVVRPGDTLFGIARATGLTLSELKSFNPDLNPGSLRPGQVIALARP